MTAAARQVLGDCEAALEMLEDEVGEQQWRVLWAGAMALVRTVGHVLKKVDGTDPRVRFAVNSAWDRWNADKVANAVFWEFIEAERNNILKEYRFSVLDSAVVDLAVVGIDQETGRAVAVESLDALDENLFRQLENGFGAGEDARDVYREALQWWDAEFSRIETDLASVN